MSVSSWSVAVAAAARCSEGASVIACLPRAIPQYIRRRASSRNTAPLSREPPRASGFKKEDIAHLVAVERLAFADHLPPFLAK